MLLRTALALFVLALVAGPFGFSGFAAAQADLVQTLFFLFGCGFLVLLRMALATERGPAGNGGAAWFWSRRSNPEQE